MESAVTAPVSGHIKRVVVQEGARLRTEQTPKVIELMRTTSR